MFSSALTVRDFFAAAPLANEELAAVRQQYEAAFPNQPTYTLQELRFFYADTMLLQRERVLSERPKNG